MIDPAANVAAADDQEADPGHQHLVAALAHHLAGRLAHMRVRDDLQRIRDFAARARGAHRGGDKEAVRQLLGAIARAAAAGTEQHDDAGRHFVQARRAIETLVAAEPAPPP